MVTTKLSGLPMTVNVGAEHSARVTRIRADEMIVRQEAVDASCPTEHHIDVRITV